MKRLPLVCGNWKMQMTQKELNGFFVNYKNEKNVEVLIASSFVHIDFLPKDIRAAQDVSRHSKGAYTGEVSATTLKELGVKYCIIGHSERRLYHNENTQDIKLKLTELLEVGIKPIVCIGENKPFKEFKKVEMFIKKEIKALFKNVKKEVIIAYEPVWAISTFLGKNKKNFQISVEYIQKITNIIKSISSKEKNSGRLIYGGSVNSLNIVQIAAIKNIDGVLVGGASTNHKSFKEIINAFK